jgi:enamine deaminase RidA (YjgF/YER057c/UK114 family)
MAWAESLEASTVRIEAKLDRMGLILPEAAKVPEGTPVPPYWIRVRNNVAYVSGQSARNPDGTAAGPFGKVPSEVSLEDARLAAKGCALSILGTLQRELGDLDRISAWLSVTGMVNADPGFTGTSGVINGFSDFIVDLFGPEIGAHARTSPGMAALPSNSAVVISAIVEVDGN